MGQALGQQIWVIAGSLLLNEGHQVVGELLPVFASPFVDAMYVLGADVFRSGQRVHATTSASWSRRCSDMSAPRSRSRMLSRTPASRGVLMPAVWAILSTSPYWVGTSVGRCRTAMSRQMPLRSLAWVRSQATSAS